jgi:hypothetical protein
MSLFVGKLSNEVSKQEFEDLFKKHGKIIRCDVKPQGLLFFYYFFIIFLFFFYFLFFI